MILQFGKCRDASSGYARTLSTVNELLLRAFELDPSDVRTLVALGNVKRESGLALAAARMYRTALMVRTVSQMPRLHRFQREAAPVFLTRCLHQAADLAGGCGHAAAA